MAQGEIYGSDYDTILWLTLFGPLTTLGLLGCGLIYLLVTIPYKIIFPEKKDKEAEKK